MKNVLVAFELAPSCQAQHLADIASLSLAVAELFGSYLEVVGIAPPLPASWMVGEIELSTPEATRPCSEDEVYAAYERAFQRAHTPRKCTWSGLLSAEELGPFARRFDLVCMARPSLGPFGPSREPVEHALFESGGPMLLASERRGRLNGKVVISWTDTVETARATRFALPLLKSAAGVHLVSIRRQHGPEPSPEPAMMALRRHGVPAECSILDDRGDVGRAVLDFAYAMNADLLVKGAYTQTRLRRLIFGGTTNHILEHCAIPIFVAH